MEHEAAAIFDDEMETHFNRETKELSNSSFAGFEKCFFSSLRRVATSSLPRNADVSESIRTIYSSSPYNNSQKEMKNSFACTVTLRVRRESR